MDIGSGTEKNQSLFCRILKDTRIFCPIHQQLRQGNSYDGKLIWNARKNNYRLWRQGFSTDSEFMILQLPAEQTQNYRRYCLYIYTHKTDCRLCKTSAVKLKVFEIIFSLLTRTRDYENAKQRVSKDKNLLLLMLQVLLWLKIRIFLNTLLCRFQKYLWLCKPCTDYLDYEERATKLLSWLIQKDLRSKF